MSPTYHLGLDLGKMSDYTALTVVEETPAPGTLLRLRHAERPALGTPYTRIAERIHQVQNTAPLTPDNTRVVVDLTGVGIPVFEMLEAQGIRRLFGITIHGGDAVSRDRNLYRVPKRDLVSTLQVLLQQGRLKFADGLPSGDVLRAELQNFKATINLATGHDTYEAWREGDHDDLVLSLALACWFAENVRPQPGLRKLW